MDEYYYKNYDSKTIKFQNLNNKTLPLSKNIESELMKLTNNLDTQLDFIVLYYVAFFHLSSTFIKHLNKGEQGTEKLLQNCKNLTNNAIVKSN